MKPCNGSLSVLPPTRPPPPAIQLHPRPPRTPSPRWGPGRLRKLLGLGRTAERRASWALGWPKLCADRRFLSWYPFGVVFQGSPKGTPKSCLVGPLPENNNNNNKSRRRAHLYDSLGLQVTVKGHQ